MLVDQLDIPSTISKLSLSFKGSPNSPFLAPRGVWIKNRSLFVSDTGQNRVFIWDRLPLSEHEPPDVVLGQEEEKGTGRNANHRVSASTLQYPSGLWSDGEKLIVADAWNHRVLIWNEMPTENGQPADVVIGQKGFDSNEPNLTGLNAPCSSQTLYWPYGVFSDGNQLWVADTGNRRVLYFKQIPTENFASADHVIGKPDFESRDYENNEPIWPYSVRVNEDGNLAITDTQCFRVLIWKDWKKAIGSTPPDQIVGQKSMADLGQNQYHLTPTPQSLNWCYDSFFYEKGLLVMDTANSRIKWHHQLFQQNNPVSDGLFGQPNYATGSENVQNAKGTETTLYWPFSICAEDTTLGVADTGNHRVLLNELII
ncbi:MAG: hypothetical protein HRT61_19715 [Ekhidna sp.]|nr:hypothetical protein [Ekhidna sp.]